MDISKIADVILKLTISLCLVALVLSFFKKTEEKYAYVEYHGGYQALGYINRENAFIDAEMFFDDKKITDDWEEAISILEDSEHGDILNDGFELNIDYGVEWDASKTTFKLSTGEKKFVSNGELKASDVLNEIKKLEEDNIQSYRATSAQSLRFEKAPTDSFLSSKVTNWLQNL